MAGGDTILRFEGRSWRTDRVQASAELKSIWAASPSRPYVAGLGGLAHRVADKWQMEDLGLQFVSVRGSSADDVWAVGEKGAVYRFDGAGWHPVRVSLESLLALSRPDPRKEQRRLWLEDSNDRDYFSSLLGSGLELR